MEMYEKVVDLIDYFCLDIFVIIGYDVYIKLKGVKGDLVVYRYLRYFV